NNILYAGTGEGNYIRRLTYYGCGVLKTIDGGKKWELKGGGDKGPLNGARFFRIAVNPLKTSIIFAATSFGLYRSSNEGEEWKKMTNGLPEISNSIRAVTDIVINPDDPD